MHLLRRTLGIVGLVACAGAAVFVVLCFVPSETTVPPIRPRESTRYWEMSKGYRIAYTKVPAAEPSGKPPVVFLHGGPGGYVYDSTIETMGRFAAYGHDVYLYDQVGSGLSDRIDPWGYSVENNVRDLHEIVTDHIAAEQIVLIAQSYGADLATHLMARYPGLVARAVLTSPGTLDPTIFEDGEWVNLARYPQPESLEFIAPLEVMHHTYTRKMSPRTIAALALATLFNVKLMGDEEADGVLDALAGRIAPGMACNPARVPPEQGGGGFYAHYLGNWYGDLDDPRPALSRQETPVLVLQGQCDIFPYAGAYEFADVFPNGTYRFIEGAGHEIWWDQPDVFVEEIEAFLE